LGKSEKSSREGFPTLEKAEKSSGQRFPTLGNIGTEALYLIATLFGAKKSLFETLNTVKT
jgi:hypothetical protein